MPGTVAILANPMSGRDVRRLAARATNMTHEAKRDLVARVAAGVDAAGVDRILILKEPFAVSTAALERMPLRAQVEVLDVGVTNSALDTVRAVQAAQALGCEAIVSLGGDGTNRIISRTWAESSLMPLSTGTNNVFPVLVEATSAGLAAGLLAAGHLKREEVTQRCKLIHFQFNDVHDVGVIDAVLLRRDHIGNFLPFDPERIDQLLLTRAEPAAVGMSPIGGLLHPLGTHDDGGLHIRCGGHIELNAPISPGLFKPIRVHPPRSLRLGERIEFVGPGVIAFDGDRERKLENQERGELWVARDGPHIIDVQLALRRAAELRVFDTLGLRFASPLPN